MNEVGLVLNIHGEVPSDNNSVCVLDAEEHFLAHLDQLVQDFPQLKIVLEHVTSAKAVEMVKRLPENVAATITLHHLAIIVDDWAGNPHNFCKPVAKYPKDRSALQQVVKEANPKFFLGTDSAPHPKSRKESNSTCAGVYTGAYIGQYLGHIMDDIGALDNIIKFSSEFGSKFYGLKPETRTCTLVKRPFVVPEEIEYTDDQGLKQFIVPFMAGKQLNYSVDLE